jgi:hypothetical protein
MKNSENTSASYVGHVKNGVVVLDSHVVLKEGQAVRVEALPASAQPQHERTDRARRLQQLLAEWAEEDGKLSDEEAGRLQSALSQNRGLGFRSPMLD